MGYSVNYDATLLNDTTAMNLSMDYIANLAVDVRVYKNGTLLAYPADYTFSNIVQFPYYTTFTLNFVETAVSGSVIRIEKNEEWNQWIQFKFPEIENRVQALEAQLTTATNVAARLTALETNLSSAQADIVTLNGLISGHDAEINQAQLDIGQLQTVVGNIAIDVANLKAFMGVEGEVVINNDQSTPLVVSDLTIDGYEYSSVKVDYEIMRRTGADYKSSVGTMYLVCKDNGVWYTERGLNVIDLDGVTFSINTDGNRVGTFSYVSDYLAGAGYVGYFKYRTTKFEV